MVTDRDPQAQIERQLWAAYRLILQWPKRDGRPAEPTGDEPGQNEVDRADGARLDCEDVPVMGGNR
jgi:hypothetical protein